MILSPTPHAVGVRRLGPICTAAVIHLAAAVPNFAWLEERLYPYRHRLHRGVNNALLQRQRKKTRQRL